MWSEQLGGWVWCRSGERESVSDSLLTPRLSSPSFLLSSLPSRRLLRQLVCAAAAGGGRSSGRRRQGWPGGARRGALAAPHALTERAGSSDPHPDPRTVCALHTSHCPNPNLLVLAACLLVFTQPTLPLLTPRLTLPLSCQHFLSAPPTLYPPPPPHSFLAPAAAQIQSAIRTEPVGWLQCRSGSEKGAAGKAAGSMRGSRAGELGEQGRGAAAAGAEVWYREARVIGGS